MLVKGMDLQTDMHFLILLLNDKVTKMDLNY